MNTCQQCTKTMGAHFAISRVDAQGVATSTTKLCSLTCAGQWAYTSAIQRGAQGVMLAKFALSNVLDTIRGPRRG